MTSEVIRVSDFSFSYSATDRPIIRDLNLRVGEGDFVLVAGPSGCGKTTFCRSLNGLIPHFYSGETTGEVVVGGHEVANTSTHRLSQTVGYVFQNPDNQLVMSTVARDVAFGLENLALDQGEIRERTGWALGLLDIRGLWSEPIDSLSGGQKQMVALAGAIAMRPSVLVLDEPTSYLSPSSAKSFFELVSKLLETLDLSVILVEHRLDLASRHADRLLVMREGKFVVDGPPKEVLGKDPSSLGYVNLPTLTVLYHTLKRMGVELPSPPLDPGEAHEMVTEALHTDRS